MAQYRLSVSIISRKEGRSATAAAAYRAGQEIADRRLGETFDFTRRSGVLYSEIILPASAPSWAADRAEFWNRAEAAEKRSDAHVAREIQLSLPHELTRSQRRELALEFARHIAERYELAVDVNVHAPDRRGDERNYHAHLLVSTRPFDEESKTGFGNKDRRLDMIASKRSGQEGEIEHLRTVWEEQTNRALERANVRTPDGTPVRVDRRSYERLGIEQEPTVKEGAAVTGLKRRGEPSERAETNAEIRARNTERKALEAEIAAAEQELATLTPRRASGMTARDAYQALAYPETVDLLPTPPRQAQHLTSEQAVQEPIPANDNAPPKSAARAAYDKLLQEPDPEHKERDRVREQELEL